MKEAMSNAWEFCVFWAVLTATLVVPGCEANCSFPAIFNFGDSNTDTGGFWAAFPPQRPPNGMTYFNKPVGRASDGRVIVDFLGFSVEEIRKPANIAMMAVLDGFQKACSVDFMPVAFQAAHYMSPLKRNIISFASGEHKIPLFT